MPIQRALTPRQSAILKSVARGKTNKDIAGDLGISEQGVKVHISRLLERYGAENRVELVAVTRAWAEADERGYAALTGDIAGIRAGLNKTYQEDTAVSETRGGNGHGNGHLAPAAPRVNGNGHAPLVSDLSAEVRALRGVLEEINVALKLAREMPADVNVGPLVDAVRARVEAALQQSAKLDTLVDRERDLDRRTRQSAN